MKFDRIASEVIIFEPFQYSDKVFGSKFINWKNTFRNSLYCCNFINGWGHILIHKYGIVIQAYS